MTQRTTCFVLRFHSANMAVYTNLLHTYYHLVKITPESYKKKLPSYRTLARKLSETGSIETINTAMGTYYIEHHPILLRVAV